VLGTRNVLDAAAAAGVGRFVHISSVRAFSDLDFPDGVDEQHPVRPDGNPYVDTKIASEQVVLQAHAAGEIECTIVRPGDVYGPGSRPWTVLPLEIIKSNRFLLPAMGRGVFSPVYVDDLVSGLVLAAERPEAAGQVFTIGPERGVPAKEFFAHYFRMLGKRGPLCLPTPLAVAAGRTAGAAERLRGNRTEINAASMLYLARPGGYSIEKARRLLGYEPKVDLDEGMRRTEAWLREQRLL
jgi:nucleoside-diphosphate-sugar epimerase